MRDLLKRVLDWFGKVLPTTFVVGGALSIYQYLMGNISRLLQKNRNLETELEYKANAEKVHEANSGKSSSDIVRDAIRKGSKPVEPGAK